MLIVIGRVACAEGRREDLVAHMKTMQEASRAEPGCLDYGFFAAVEDPDKFVAVELWESRQALETHFAAPSVAAFTGGLAGLITGVPKVEIHHVEKTTDFPNLD